MILLTREITEYLTSEGFPSLTIKKDANGFINLTGRECSQPIMRLSDMQVSTKLTAKEREIIKNDYLIPTIKKYGDDISELITLASDKTTENDLQAYKEELEDHFDVLVEEDSFTSYYGDLNFEHASLKMKVNVPDGDNIILSVSCRVDADKTSNKLVATDMDAKSINKYAKRADKIAEKLPEITKEYVALYMKKRDHKDKIQEVKEALVAKCAIM